MTERKLKEDPSSKDQMMIFGLGFLILLIGFFIAYQFVEPAPPNDIKIATGSESGNYYSSGEKYRDFVKKEEMNLEVISTAGSVENLNLLKDPDQGVDFGFVQSGFATKSLNSSIVGLASLYFEPLWIFYKNKNVLNRLTDLKGVKIAIGEEGSGTQEVALKLLSENGISDSSFVSIGGEKAIKALHSGQVEAAFMISSPKSQKIKDLLLHPDIKLMSFSRAEAYARKHDFLAHLTLPEGVIDFEKNIPPTDIQLIAPAALLVARNDVHPALISLILQAATRTHEKSGLFEKHRQFPSLEYVDFPQQEDAERYIKKGPPFLQKFLPFWAATLIDRMLVMLIPIITLLIPLFKIVPPTYAWRSRSRIYRWYEELQVIDEGIDEVEHLTGLKDYFEELDRIEREVIRVKVPLSYAESLYNLRLHIEMVRNRTKLQQDILKNKLLAE